ncbi:hypothetical protein BAY59_26620 [Prauserella coralliicola]|nr:hypothetical protein BAY59_26620 [Prauserella coralliicola]
MKATCTDVRCTRASGCRASVAAQPAKPISRIVHVAPIAMIEADRHDGATTTADRTKSAVPATP